MQIRQMSDHGPRLMHIQPSRFQWNKWKDYLHFYTLVGTIPLLTLVGLVNIFVGPATLEPIPDGYQPKHWEYHRVSWLNGFFSPIFNFFFFFFDRFQHPISRFMARYVFPTPQQDYEKRMHVIYVDHEKRQLLFLEEKIQKLIKKRRDYEAYYYRPVSAKDFRLSKEAISYLQSIWGDE